MLSIKYPERLKEFVLIAEVYLHNNVKHHPNMAEVAVNLDFVQTLEAKINSTADKFHVPSNTENSGISFYY